VRCQVRGLVCLGEPRAATLLTLPPSAIAEASDSQGRSPLLVRAGSARHQEALVPGGHERSPSAKADRRSKAVHRYDLGWPSSVGQGSNPSYNCRMPCLTLACPAARATWTSRPAPRQRGLRCWLMRRMRLSVQCWICREFVRALERAVLGLSLVRQHALRARTLVQDSWSMSRISARLSERAQSRWDS
jgi:hypothetical protein